MKSLIEYYLNHNAMKNNLPRVIEHIFATLGNGIEMDHHGYIRGNYRDDEAFEFPEPTPFEWIYPWSKSEEFQPFRKLAGCRDTGFKDAAKYFIECIKATPDDVANIAEWKENLSVVEDVLLNTPDIEPRYSSKDDMDKFLDDIKEEEPTSNAPEDGTVLEERNSVYKIWFFDVQWSDCPEYVEEEVANLWRDHELGNDYYMWKRTLDDEMFESYPRIYFWLKHKGVAEGEEVVVHWWW